MSEADSGRVPGAGAAADEAGAHVPSGLQGGLEPGGEVAGPGPGGPSRSPGAAERVRRARPSLLSWGTAASAAAPCTRSPLLGSFLAHAAALLVAQHVLVYGVAAPSAAGLTEAAAVAAGSPAPPSAAVSVRVPDGDAAAPSLDAPVDAAVTSPPLAPPLAPPIAPPAAPVALDPPSARAVEGAAIVAPAPGLLDRPLRTRGGGRPPRAPVPAASPAAAEGPPPAGVPGGATDAPPRPGVPAAAPEERAAILTRVEPDYPSHCARRGCAGTAVVEVTVGADGLPHDAVVVTSAGCDRLDRAALAATARFRFRAATRGAEPVASVEQLVFRFETR